MFSEEEILTKIHEMFAEEPFILLELNKILPKCNRLVNYIFNFFYILKKFFSFCYFFTLLLYFFSQLLMENMELNY